MEVKKRILLLKDFLQENSDENQPVTTAEIISYLNGQGCPVSTVTLRNDIQTILDADPDDELEITERKASRRPMDGYPDHLKRRNWRSLWTPFHRPSSSRRKRAMS